ncbi:Tryptophan synthase alpha chain [Streptomyces griseorubiginosus]
MGVTGTRESVGAQAQDLVERTRAAGGDLPVCVGLGVSNAKQGCRGGRLRRRVIVGSAFVKLDAGRARTTRPESRASAGLAAELAKGVRRQEARRTAPVMTSRTVRSLERVDLGPGRRGVPPRFVLRVVSEKNR